MFKRIDHRGLRIFSRMVVALIVFVLAWFIINRLTAPMRAVRVVDLPWPRASREGTNTDASPRRVRVMIWNIAHGRGVATTNWVDNDLRRARLADIAALIAAEDPDVVILNEVDFDAVWSGHENQARFIASRSGFAHVVEQRSYDVAIPFCRLRFGNAVLSRLPITRARRVSYPVYSRWQWLVAGKKDGALVEVSLPGGERLGIVPVHLDHRDEATRMASAELFTAMAGSPDDRPIIFAGDFNSTLPGLPMADVDDRGHTAMSLLLAGDRIVTQPIEADASPAMTFPSAQPDRLIDWIAVSSPARVMNLRVIDSTLSDHRPVIADILLSPDGGGGSIAGDGVDAND